MARQLTADGEEVPLVVVLDAKAPRHPTSAAADTTTEASALPSPGDSTKSATEKTGAAGNISSRYRRAMADYTPAAYSGKIAVLRSAHTRDARPNLGWSSVSDHVEMRTIPGSHHASITRYVAETGARIRACLDATNDLSK